MHNIERVRAAESIGTRWGLLAFADSGLGFQNLLQDAGMDNSPRAGLSINNERVLEKVQFLAEYLSVLGESVYGVRSEAGNA